MTDEDFEVFHLAAPVTVTCPCGASTTTETLVKVGAEFTIPSRGEDDPAMVPTPSGWRCLGCESAASDRERTEAEAVPGRPSEWRFCQQCGDRLPPTQEDGQFCETCAGETGSGDQARR